MLRNCHTLSRAQSVEVRIFVRHGRVQNPLTSSTPSSFMAWIEFVTSALAIIQKGKKKRVRTQRWYSHNLRVHMRMDKGVEVGTNLSHVSSIFDLHSTLQCNLGSSSPYACSACIQLHRQERNRRNHLNMPVKNVYINIQKTRNFIVTNQEREMGPIE